MSGFTQATMPLPTGEWGGQGLALTVTLKGAHLEFDCAHGDITKAIVLDATGHFDVDGVYVQEHGGAVREGEPPDSKPIHYAGRVDGTTLMLTMSTPGSTTTLGQFTVSQNSAGRVRKCR